ncbi:transglutaminase TgpA family protein [Arthrobacter sp. 2MCAF14]|uniref:transglutaminase TgpA family protein n=1 Tax=Arthrobacter sp. 2MCAF14 TaxID=3232982 RepID=UPI003F906A37
MSAAIAVAVLGASLSLNGVFRGWAWLVPAITTVFVVGLTLAILRAVRVHPVLTTLGGLLALVFILDFTFFRPESIAGFIPSGATLDTLGQFLKRAGETVVSETAPVSPNAGIVFVACAALGLVAVLVDALAVPLGMPATSGLGLLVVLVFPATIKPQGGGLPGFLAAAVGFILILGCSQWFAPDSRLQTDNAHGTGQLKRSMVIGGVALALGLLLPLAVPGFERGTFPVGSRLNPWGVSNGLNPMITLGNSLRNPTGDGSITYATSSTAPVYLRSVTIDKFDGDTWAPDDREASRRIGPGRMGPDYPLPSELVRQVTVVDTGQFTSPYLPVPYAPTAVNGLSGRWSWDPATLSIRGEDGTTRNQQYTVYSALPALTSATLSQDNAKPTSISQDFIQLPSNVPDIVKNTAKTVTAGANGNYAKAMAIQDYLRSSQFSYSLQAPVQGGYDGNGMSVLADFLQQKSGYCVHFASAMAVMARLEGIPSRIAVGYAPGHATGATVAVAGQEPLPEYQVDARDAHAWPELYFEGVGWVAFEPTPSRGVVPPYASEAAAAGGPSTNLHDENLTPGSSTPAPSTAAVPPVAGPGVGSGTASGSATILYVTAAALLLAVLAASPRLVRSGIRARRLRPARAKHPGSGGTAGQAEPRDGPVLAWAELQDLATDYGVPPVPSETPRHFAARLSSSVALGGPAAAASPSGAADDAGQHALASLTGDFERQRYGPPAGIPANTTAEEANPAGDRITAVRAAFRRNASWFAVFRADWFPPSLMSRWFQLLWSPFRWLGGISAAVARRSAASVQRLFGSIRWRR